MDAFFFNPPAEINFLGHQVAEIYKDKIYDPYLIGKKDLTIVDVGANIGMVTYYFSKFAKVVHALEPSFEHFDILTRMVAFNKLDNVVPHKLAIYMKSGDYPLYHNSANKTMFSLHMAIDDKKEKPEEVRAVTLKEFFDEQKIEMCDLLKLDVEGSEYEILGGSAFREVAPRIKTIILEYHAWGNRNPNQLIDSMKAGGFSVNPVKTDATLLVGTK